MIELTRLNGNAIVLNSDLIKTAESSPDTMLTLITGEKLIVREELREVVERVLEYRARLLRTVAGSPLDQCSISGMLSVPDLKLASAYAKSKERKTGQEATAEE